MSIIQSIRERGALISAIIIALALLGFILMDAFSGRSNLFSRGNATTLAIVNGRKLDFREFEEKIKIQEQNASQRGSIGEQARQQIISSLWNQEINRLVMLSEFEKLGLKVGDKELSEIIFNNPLPQFYQVPQFMDPETGQFNMQGYRDYIQYLQANSSKDPLVRQEYNAIIEAVEYTRLNEKYNAMALASSYLPKWFIEKQNSENSGLASISYVLVPYSSISDSTIQVSDKEIEEYIKKHKDRYQQKESRSIEFVSFSAAPSAADSAAIRDQLESLKAPFKEAQDNEAFVSQNYSEIGYYKSPLKKDAIQAPEKDSVIAAGAGNVYGPYVFGNNYMLAKLVRSARWPDTVKVRHILVSTAQRSQQGQLVPVREDSAAKRIIDSVEAAIRGGAIFDSLCLKYSDDPGSREKGGVYDSVYLGQMVPEFNDFIFSNPVGSKGVVKTEFGYHYIEVLAQRGSVPVYQVAYITKAIVASKETDNTAQNAAAKLAAEARTLEAFNDYVKKNLEPRGINKMPATLAPDDYNIMGAGVSRQLVREIYKAKKGEVLQPVRVGDDYVVAVVTEVLEEGLQPVEKARPFTEPLIRNEKKAEQIISKIGSYNTLEEAAAKTGFSITRTDSIRFSGGQMSHEPKLIGAAFNPDITGKVLTTPIKGNNGVYVLKVNELTATAVAQANIDLQRMQFRNQAMQRISGGGYYGGPMSNTPSAVLRKVAKIKDKRSDFNY